MHNTMSQTESPRSAPTVTLRRIWSVRADGSYEVSHAPRADETTIALRTMEGEGVIELKNGIFSLRADSLLLFSSSDIRRYGTKNNFWHFYWFEFECPSLLLPLCRPMTVTDPSEDWPELCYAALSDSGRSAYVSSVFGAMLTHWLQFADEKDTDPGTLVAEQAVRYIQVHFGERETGLARLARSLGVSDRYLRKVFREKTGLSPQDYISECRIRSAKERLETTSEEINSIALSLGYQNQYYFSNFFKAKTGMSPSAYRENARASSPETKRRPL